MNIIICTQRRTLNCSITPYLIRDSLENSFGTLFDLAVSCFQEHLRMQRRIGKKLTCDS